MFPVLLKLNSPLCGYQVLPATFENGGNCTVAQRVCVYYASGEAVIAGKALYRAKAFRAATPGDVGQSPGFTTPGDGTADVTVALTAAVADYSARVPAWRGECPAFPIVMVRKRERVCFQRVQGVS